VDFASAMPDAWRVFFTGRTAREVQARAMPAIIRGASVILSGPTASGKTEAALAPLYQRHVSFRRQRVSVVYVAPTRALVNDMYERLMSYFGASSPDLIQRYTGDHHGFTGPDGRFLLLATPEALDSLQLMRPEWLSSVRALVLDELHLLHGTARGQQLRAVVARLRAAARRPSDERDIFQTVAMTATIRDSAAVGATWCGAGVQVIEVGGGRSIEMDTIPTAHGTVGHALAVRVEELVKAGEDPKILVFANSRNRAHALAAELAELLRRTKIPVFFHSGVLARTERERVEVAMKRGRNGICVATSTLEVGIDIGDIDLVALAQPTHSVAAFMQRIGRGNRRSGRCRVWALAADQSERELYACLQHCAAHGEIDDLHDYHRPSVDFQQVLSLVWLAMRTDLPATRRDVVARAGGAIDGDIVEDMLLTGALRERRGVLVLSDDWADFCDGRAMHTVLSAGPARSMVDMKTGDVLGIAGGTHQTGSMVYTGTRLKLVKHEDGGGVYLGPAVPGRRATLAKFPSSTGRAPGPSRPVVWAAATLRGEDPARWALHDQTLVTWGGSRYNALLAAVLRAAGHPKGIRSTPTALHGVQAGDVAPSRLSEIAQSVCDRRLVSTRTARAFIESTRFLSHLSPALAAEEAQRALPFSGLLQWLERCSLRHTS
jgi:ATP-dependent helicase Lhr and Lhr-like helicase